MWISDAPAAIPSFKIESASLTAGAERISAPSNSSTEESTPVNPPVITSIRVETYGVDYGIPETLEPFDSSAWIMNYYNMNSSSVVTQ